MPQSLRRSVKRGHKLQRRVGHSNKVFVAAAITVAVIYATYVVHFIFHTQTNSEVYRQYHFPEHRGSGERVEWGLKNRGTPAGLLPIRPRRRRRGVLLDDAGLDQNTNGRRNSGKDSNVGGIFPTDEKSKLLSLIHI